MKLEFAASDAILFFNHFYSISGFFGFSFILLGLSLVRPLWTLSLLCFYPNIFWAASCKIPITIYPIYLVVAFLGIRYLQQIFLSLLEFRYGLCILIPLFIMFWSYLSPWIYSSGNGVQFHFNTNPNFIRWLQISAVLILIPSMLRSREDIRNFLLSTLNVMVVLHIVFILISLSFIASGHKIYHLQLMSFLNMLPIFWESGLLILFLGYVFVQNDWNSLIIILLVIVGIVGLVIGFSRTRFLTTAICMAYFIRPYISKRLFVWFTVFLLILTMFIGSATFFFGGKHNFLSKILSQRIEQSMSNDKGQVMSGRDQGWAYAIGRWKTNKLIGVGSCYVFPMSRFFFHKKTVGRAHNYYIEILAGQGVVGLALLTYFLMISLIMVFRIIMVNPDNVIEGRFLIALFIWGLINWIFKESWGITYPAIALLSVYITNDEDELPTQDLPEPTTS